MKRLFGLEKDFFDELGKKERNIYRLMFVLFLIILALAGISGGYLVYMISTSIYLSLFGAVFFGFIIFSILRFSLISIERNLKFPDAKFRFFSSTFLFRLVLLSFFGMVVGVPLVSFIQQKELLPLLEARRQEMTLDYQQYLEESRSLNLKDKQSKIQHYEQRTTEVIGEIQSLEQEISRLDKEDSRYSTIKFELLALRNEEKSINEKQGQIKNELYVQDSLIQSMMEEKIIGFEEQIAESALPIFQMSLATTTSKGKAFIALFSFLFVLLLILLLWLNHSKKFLYAKRAVYYHRDFTQSTYYQTEVNIEHWFRTRYGVDYESPSAYLDAPFNKVPNTSHIRKESEMKLKDYLSQLS